MNSNITKNVADPVSNQDVASKNYVDKKNAFTTAGDIKLSVGSDLVRSLGCNDLSAGKKFYRHKFANVFGTQFTITSAHQDKN